MPTTRITIVRPVTAPQGYRADIDGLRAIAVLAVVGFHAFPDKISGGFVGVDVFFVISGFLISAIIFAGLEQGSFSYAEFYARRIKRIFPALIAVLLACLAFGWFAFGADDYRHLGGHVAVGAAFVSNFVLWNEAGYFDAAAETKPLLHLWSLGIEEQFYIAWPLLLGWAWRRWNFFACVAVMAAASFALSLHLTGSNMVAAFYSPLTRFWELMAGGMLAYVQSHRPGLLPARSDLFSAIGLVAIALGVVLFDGNTSFPGWAAIAPVAGALLVLAAGPAAWCNRRLLAAGPLVWCGLVSYPLYLWHWPLLVFFNRAGPPSAARQMPAIAAAIVLARITWRLVETPVRGGGRRATAITLVAILAATGCAGAYVYQRDGLAARAGNRRLEAGAHWMQAQRWSEADYHSAACLSLYPEAYYCMLEAGAGAPGVALIGDSFANSLYYGLRDAYRKRGLTLVQLGNGGCPPLVDVASDYAHRDINDCTDRNNAYLRKIAADPNIGTVVMAANWHLYLTGLRFRAPPIAVPEWQLRLRDRPDLADNPAVFAEAFERTVKLLTEAGKRVIFVRQTPELEFRLADCTPDRDAALAPCRGERRKVQAYLAEYESLVDPLLKRHPSIAVVDPLEVFCDQEFCYATRNGLLLYRDGLHLSRGGSAYLGEKIALPD